MDEQIYDKLAAAFEPLGRRACPIYLKDDRGRVNLIGTGIPVIHGQRGMLVTATHVLTEFGRELVVIGGATKILRFPIVSSGFSPHRDGSVDVDIAAMALPAEAVTEMKGFYRFTTANELGKVDDEDKLTLYAFVGCPYSKNQSKPSAERRVQPYFYTTNAFGTLGDVTTPGKTELTHFVMKFSLKKTMGRGQPYSHAPKPQGISGCGVWKVRFDSHTGSASEPELVGIGIEFIRESNVFVATRTGPAAIAISTLGKDLDAEKLGGTGLSLQPNDPA